MNSDELTCFLSNNKYTRRIFEKVVAADQLPLHPVEIKNRNEKKAYVINEDDSSKPGKHWIAIIISNTTVDIFNSSGESYKRNKYFKNFVNINSRNRKIIEVQKQLQSIYSDLCGEFTCLYLLARSRNIMPRTFYKYFSYTNDLIENDFTVYDLFNKCFLNSNVVKSSHTKNQCCTARYDYICK